MSLLLSAFLLSVYESNQVVFNLDHGFPWLLLSPWYASSLPLFSHPRCTRGRVEDEYSAPHLRGRSPPSITAYVDQAGREMRKVPMSHLLTLWSTAHGRAPPRPQ